MKRINIIKKAFSLAETAVAIVIMGMLGASAFIIINRSMASTAEIELKIQAFSEARDNMEKLLSKSSLSEMTEFGESERFDQITWQTNIESFYEPLTQNMWLKAVCSAEYIDTKGEPQNVELTNWITRLSKKDVIKIVEQKQRLAAENNKNNPKTSKPGKKTADPDTNPNPDTDPNSDTNPNPDQEHPIPNFGDMSPQECLDALSSAPQDNEEWFNEWFRTCLPKVLSQL